MLKKTSQWLSELFLEPLLKENSGKMDSLTLASVEAFDFAECQSQEENRCCDKIIGSLVMKIILLWTKVFNDTSMI